MRHAYVAKSMFGKLANSAKSKQPERFPDTEPPGSLTPTLPRPDQNMCDLRF